MYTAEMNLMEQLLTDPGVRTENPWEANLFFVPTFGPLFYGAPLRLPPAVCVLGPRFYGALSLLQPHHPAL